MLDLPGIVEGASQGRSKHNDKLSGLIAPFLLGRGRGRQVVAGNKQRSATMYILNLF